MIAGRLFKNRTIPITVVAGLMLILTATSFGDRHAGRHSGMGYLGVSVDRLTIGEKRELGLSYGVIVTDVKEDKAADEAGIKEDDIILFFDGNKIRSAGSLIDYVRDTEPGTEVKLVIFRDGKRKEVSVTVGKQRTSTSWYWHGDDDHFLFSGFGGVYLGVRLQNLDNADLAGYFGVDKEGGVLILEVDEETPAEKAGLKAGDVIVTFDGMAVDDAEDVQEILGEYDEEMEVVVEVIRHKQKQMVTAVLEERKDHRTIHIRKNGLGDAHILRIPEMPFLQGFGHGEAMDISLDHLKHLEEDIHDKLERKTEEFDGKLERKSEKMNGMIYI